MLRDHLYIVVVNPLSETFITKNGIRYINHWEFTDEKSLIERPHLKSIETVPELYQAVQLKRRVYICLIDKISDDNKSSKSNEYRVLGHATVLSKAIKNNKFKVEFSNYEVLENAAISYMPKLRTDKYFFKSKAPRIAETIALNDKLSIPVIPTNDIQLIKDNIDFKFRVHPIKIYKNEPRTEEFLNSFSNTGQYVLNSDAAVKKLLKTVFFNQKNKFEEYLSLWNKFGKITFDPESPIEILRPKKRYFLENKLKGNASTVIIEDLSNDDTKTINESIGEYISDHPRLKLKIINSETIDDFLGDIEHVTEKNGKLWILLNSDALNDQDILRVKEHFKRKKITGKRLVIINLKNSETHHYRKLNNLTNLKNEIEKVIGPNFKAKHMNDLFNFYNDQLKGIIFCQLNSMRDSLEKLIDIETQASVSSFDLSSINLPTNFNLSDQKVLLNSLKGFTNKNSTPLKNLKDFEQSLFFKIYNLTNEFSFKTDKERFDKTQKVFKILMRSSSMTYNAFRVMKLRMKGHHLY